MDKLFVFRLGAQDLAAEAVKIFEVMMVPKLTTPAGGPPFLVGVANVRGNIVPVVDAHEKVGEKRAEPEATARLVVIKLAGDYVGFLVDSVDLRLTEGIIEGRPARAKSRGKVKLTVVSPNPSPRKARVGEKAFPVFEPDQLLTVDEQKELERVRASF